MFKSFFIFLLSCLFVIPVYAALEMQVDQDNIASDEMVTLVISSKDHLNITPDLSPLKKDFDVVGTSQSSQFNIINGTTQMETQWQIALMPKHDGDILLPSIQVGNEKTPSRIIHVTAIKKTTSQTNAVGNQDIFIEASIIPKESYIQEQFVYTIKLFYNRTIENPFLMAPDLEEAKITQNGQDIIYTTVKNGKYYRVLERSYLITPKNTGHFKITPPVLKGYLEGTSVRMNPFGFSSRALAPIKIVGPTLEINVKPKPTNFTGQWLPAKKLTISGSFDSDPTYLREGEPITQTIEVNAEGATGDQIPSLVVKTSPNLNNYPQQPKKETYTHNNLQVGKLTQKIVFIPTASGKITFPDIEIKWWNSTTKKEQVARLPSKTMNVLPALNKMPTNKASTPQKLPLTIRGQEITKNLKGNMVKTDFNFWPLISVLLIGIWLLTLLLWRRQARYGYIIKSNFVIRKAGNLFNTQKQLKIACEMNRAKQARVLFLKWATIYWKKPSLHALSDIVLILEEEHAEGLKSEIMQLEAIFYSTHKTSWNGMFFWESLQSYLKTKVTKDHSTPVDPLPPLYFSADS